MISEKIEKYNKLNTLLFGVAHLIENINNEAAETFSIVDLTNYFITIETDGKKKYLLKENVIGGDGDEASAAQLVRYSIIDVSF